MSSSFQKAQLFCQYKMTIQAYFYHGQNSDESAQNSSTVQVTQTTEQACGARDAIPASSAHPTLSLVSFTTL